MKVSLNMSREAAAVTREYESYPLCLSYICNGRILTHHYDVCIAKASGDVLCHVKAVSCA